MKKKRKEPEFDDPFLFFIKSFSDAFFDSARRPHIRVRRVERPVVLDVMWKKIMLLCHPDKHGNSETSQEVTRWLIENRPGGKKASAT